MSNFFVNGVTTFDAATFGKVMVGDTYTNGFYMTVSWRIQYDGANWVVNDGTSACTGAVAPVWNAGDNRLDITLTLTRPFTARPTAQATATAPSAHATGATYIPEARVTSATAILVRFKDAAAGTFITSVGTKMDFYLTLCGTIA